MFPSQEAAVLVFIVEPGLIYARLNHPNAEILEEQLAARTRRQRRGDLQLRNSPFSAVLFLPVPIRPNAPSTVTGSLVEGFSCSVPRR